MLPLPGNDIVTMVSKYHIPGRPKTPEPAKLVNLAAELTHPYVNRFGLTTTQEGKWALLVIIKKGTKTPIKEIEDKCKEFPINYQDEAGRIPLARPAYPSMGE